MAHHWVRWMPWVFVLIWSTGFVVARYAMPHSPPLTFLSLRYAISVLCLGVWILLARAEWPREPRQWMHLAASGALMHAGYLGGVWSAVKLGIGAGTVSLLVGLQPVLTAIWLATTQRAHPTPLGARQRWGLLLGLVGLVLVLDGKLNVGEITASNLALAVLALLSITTGTLYQKRFVARCDVRTANSVQLLSALVLSLPLALLEAEALQWHPHLLGALLWSVLVLTLGGSSLLYLLIQRGESTRVTSLFYLVPPCTALMAWWLFGEAITATMLLGLVTTVTGVALVVNAPVAARQ